MKTQATALILGATGGIGGAMAQRLHRGGWTVTALHRNAGQQVASDGIRWIQGDAMNAADVAHAARGAAVIVHAVNPPGYRNWAQLVLPMLDNSIAAARAAGSRIVLPGTVYNYGTDAFPVVHEDSPQNAFTRKGAIRVEMERRLATASTTGVRSLIVRAGDYFGPNAANNWFSQALVKPGQPVTTINNPGKFGIAHQWAYLPDVAETMCQLLAREATLDDFARFHLQGHWDHDGTQMVNAIRRVVLEENPTATVRIKSLPWWAMMAIAPFVPTLREMREMRYLWKTPVRLDNARLLKVLAEEPHTGLDEAVRTTLIGLGCLVPRTRSTAIETVA
ncbi:MAG: NAD(P)H-binding protein [Tahibacter sp.]